MSELETKINEFSNLLNNDKLYKDVKKSSVLIQEIYNLSNNKTGNWKELWIEYVKYSQRRTMDFFYAVRICKIIYKLTGIRSDLLKSFDRIELVNKYGFNYESNEQYIKDKENDNLYI